MWVQECCNVGTLDSEDLLSNRIENNWTMEANDRPRVECGRRTRREDESLAFSLRSYIYNGAPRAAWISLLRYETSVLPEMLRSCGNHNERVHGFKTNYSSLHNPTMSLCSSGRDCSQGAPNYILPPHRPEYSILKKLLTSI